MVDCLLTILVNQICRLFSTHQTPDSIIARSKDLELNYIFNICHSINGIIQLYLRVLLNVCIFYG